MKNIKLGNLSKQLPENFGECNLQQRKLLIKLRRLARHRPGQPLDLVPLPIWAELIKCLLSLSEKEDRQLTLSRWQFGQLRSMVKWVFSESLTAKPFDSFTHRGLTYYLGEPEFGNASAIEIAWANECYLSFANPQTPNPQALDELIATIARPERHDLEAFAADLANYNGDRREPFNHHLVAERAKQLADLDPDTKLLLLTYFEANNLSFVEEFGELFGGVRSQAADVPTNLGWLMSLKDVARDGYFGDFDKVCHTNGRLVWLAILDNVRKEKAAQATANANHHTP